MKIKRFEFNMFPVNSYVLWDETHEAVLIDPGCYYEEEKTALKDFITNGGLTVKHLLNTHLHIDHICGNPFCEKTFGVKSEAHEADLYWVEEAPKQSRMFGLRLDPFGRDTCAWPLAWQHSVLLCSRQLYVLWRCAVSR